MSYEMPDIPAFLDRRPAKNDGEKSPEIPAQHDTGCVAENISREHPRGSANGAARDCEPKEPLELEPKKDKSSVSPGARCLNEHPVAAVIENAEEVPDFFDDLVERSKTDNGAAFEADSVANLERLQAQDKARYERTRRRLKDAGVRVVELDKLVGQLAAATAEPSTGSGRLWPEGEPWPDPVNGAELLDALSAAFSIHMVLPTGAADALALWVLHAHGHDMASISPILAVTSPTPECGKTTLLTLLGALVPKALSASNITAAALFRTVEKWQPTLLVDEADTFLAGNDELRGIINSGHNRAAAFVIRTHGDEHEPRQFGTWAPKAIALIGKLPDTLESRALHIELRRMGPGESVTPMRGDRLDHLAPLRRQAARWVADHERDLRAAEPKMPDALTGRKADNWRHLIGIADTAGEGWPERARRAAEALTSFNSSQAASSMLLGDIRRLFTERDVDRLSSSAIVQKLAEMEDRPWPEWKAGKPITTRQLAKLLEPFKITPTTLRFTVTDVSKGYRLDQFTDAFRRYLPDQTVTPLQASKIAAFGEDASVTDEGFVTDQEAP